MGTAVCQGRAVLNLESRDHELLTETIADKSSAKKSKPGRLEDFLSVGTLKPSQRLTMAAYCPTETHPSGFEWFTVFDYSKDEPYTLENGGLIAAWVVNMETLRFELAPQDLFRSVICEGEAEEQGEVPTE